MNSSVQRIGAYEDDAANGGDTLMYRSFPIEKFTAPVIADIILGNSPDDIAESFASSCIDCLMSASRNAFQSIKREDSRDVVRACSDHSSSIRVWCIRNAALLMFYPNAKMRLECAIDVAHYAEVTLAMMSFGSIMSEQQSITKTYIVANNATGLIKIGRSINPDYRVKNLQTGSGVPLDVLAIIDGDIERNLHEKFSSLREMGEWFRDEGSIRAWVIGRLTSEGVI